MTIRKHYIIGEIISILFIALFLYTSISKLIDYQVFKDQLAELPLPEQLTPIVAFCLICSEFIVASLLLIPRWRLKGLYASLGLMILFTGYIIVLFTLDNGISCSCGGIIELLSLKQHILLNSAFILFATIGIVYERRIKKEIKSILSSVNNTKYAI